MDKRPKPGEDEDAILQMQEEFFREKNKNKDLRPSAQLTSLREAQFYKRHCTVDSRKPSKYAKSKGLISQEEKAGTSKVMSEILDQLDDDKVYFPKIIPSVLGEIIEKNMDDVSETNIQSMPSQGFPAVSEQQFEIQTYRNKIPSQNSEDFEHKLSNKMDIDIPTSSNEIKTPILNLPQKSYISSCKEADQIHQENVKKLSSMSETEIINEQQKLLSSIDPKLIAFIKSKRNKDVTDSIGHSKQRHNAESSKQTIEQMDISKINSDKNSLWDSDVLSHPNISRWLHFDLLEKDKLEWIKGIEDSKQTPKEPFEARFDFRGYLLPYTMEYTEKTKTLFHHGEEPYRPGYSLTELFELSRSAVTQQRVMALNTLAGVLEYYNVGTYKNIIELPLSKIFFVIRIALDENKTIILEAALKAMRNLIVNRIDEASLDALIGFEEGNQQPCLENDKSEIMELESQENELKDFHLAEIDLIAAALRTDIIQRVYYIIDFVRPSFNCVHYCLQILTRLARDSIDTSKKIIESDHLMNAIIKNFVPNISINYLFDLEKASNGKSVLAALKLLRILSLQNHEIAEVLLKKYNILEPVSTYISSGVAGTYGLRIQIEAFCIITNLLQNNIGTENISSLYPVIITPLYKHVHGTDIFIDSSVISATHAAVVLQLVNQILKHNIHNKDEFKFQVYPLIKEGVQKWLGQLTLSDKYTCAHLRLLCSALDCCKTIITLEDIQIKFLHDSLSKFTSSNCFSEMLNQLILCSNLLSGIDNKQLFVTKNLMSLCSNAIESGQLVLPILNPVSPLPFLASLFKVFEYIDDPNIWMLIIGKLEAYLNRLSSDTLCLLNHWFTRIETDLLFSIIKLRVKCKLSLFNPDTFYRVACKLCYVLRADKSYELQFLFDHIIFNRDWFSVDRLMSLISLEDTEGFSKTLSSMDNIKICYSKVINLGFINISPNVVLREWKEPILPRDWIYLPILDLYSRSQDAVTKPKILGEHAHKVEQLITIEKENIIKCSLEWIIFNELCFSDLLEDISITDRFCRILCVFLCDNSLFLEPKIRILLRNCVLILFKKGKISFNFDKKLTGLNNFQDFYTQIIEHFQSVSYGDPTFAACVLVPLAQQHNVKWRKLVWSEYAGCLRALDCPEDQLCYDLRNYLEPQETDASLIKSYFHALSSNLLRPNTIAHKIASYHVSKFCNKT